MIHIEKAPSAGREFLSDLADGSIGAELPSGLWLPARYEGHPALSMPYDVVSSEDTRFSFAGDLPAWGGAVGSGDEDLFLFLNDAIPVDARPHVAAIFALATSGESYRNIRSLLAEAKRQSPELEQVLGSTFLTLANLREPYYCLAPGEIYDEFERRYGFSIRYHRNNARSSGGETVRMGETSSGLSDRVRNTGFILSERLQAEIPFDSIHDVRTRIIGKPFGLNPNERVTSATVAIEPKNSIKAHVCAGCHLHIAPGSLRVTVEVDSQSRFDHHHLHISCV